MVLSFYYSRVPVQAHKQTTADQSLHSSRFLRIQFEMVRGWEQSLGGTSKYSTSCNRIKRTSFNILKSLKCWGKVFFGCREAVVGPGLRELWVDCKLWRCFHENILQDGWINVTSQGRWAPRDRLQSAKPERSPAETSETSLQWGNIGAFVCGPWQMVPGFITIAAAALCQTESQLNHL